MRTVVAFLVAWAGFCAGCGSRVGVDQPWSKAPPPAPDETGGGGSGATAASSGGGGAGGSIDCPASCNDGNDCTSDVCVSGACEHFGADSPTACTTPQQHAGVCAWTTCILTDCGQAENTDGEKCFYEGGVGVCEDGVCEAPCETDLDCDDGNPCSLDYCMETGACSNPEETLHVACGEAGHCWEGECCDGCFNLAANECQDTCPTGQACSADGACQ